MVSLHVRTQSPQQILDLTERLNRVIHDHQLDEGVCVSSVLHTTAALTTGEVGEGTEEDLLEVVQRIIPSIRFRHAHDPGHAWSHMAASLLGPSLTLPIAGGRLALGTWQSVLLVELDGPRERTVSMALIASA